MKIIGSQKEIKVLRTTISRDICTRTSK